LGKPILGEIRHLLGQNLVHEVYIFILIINHKEARTASAIMSQTAIHQCDEVVGSEYCNLDLANTTSGECVLVSLVAVFAG
jgi:hypothetical protein